MKLTAPVIYGLLASILMVSAPHADHLPLWIDALCAMLLLWRAYLTRTSGHDTLLAKRADRGNGRSAAPPAPEGFAPPGRSGDPLPRHWLLLGITFAGIAGILFEYHTLFGREAGVTLLIMLVALKQLELRTVRDARVVIYLACFIIITNFFYSQSIPTALFMFATLLVVVATWLHLETGGMALQPRLRLAGVMLAQAVPLMLVLFILFPRVSGPLWGLPQDSLAYTGLTDTMTPGNIAKLALSDAVAFRVTFKGKPPPLDRMYWRGPVLWDFDGRSWTMGNAGGYRPAQLDQLGNPVDYSVMLEPHGKNWLFALEMPTHVSIPASMSYDFQLRQKKPVNERMRYDVESQLDYRANVQEEPFQLKRALLLPRGLDPRARELAGQWRAASRDDIGVVQAALRYFNQQGFSYTLEPPPLAGFNTIDDFLFNTKRGFCEHYASAFVFLMRAAGIPARVVTGYQGGEFNELGNYYIVRQSDAHAWAEVWLPGRGWMRVDPTAAIAPTRVEKGLAASIPARDTAALPLFERTSSPWLRKLRFNLDAIAYQWNQWVLGYDTERQMALLTRLGMEDITWRKLAMQLAGIMALLIGTFALLMLRRLSVRNTDEVQRLYLKFCRKLEPLGIRRAEHEGPQDFAARVAQAQPQLAAAVNDISTRYVGLRYAAIQEEGRRKSISALKNAVIAFRVK